MLHMAGQMLESDSGGIGTRGVADQMGLEDEWEVVDREDDTVPVESPLPVSRNGSSNGWINVDRVAWTEYLPHFLSLSLSLTLSLSLSPPPSLPFPPSRSLPPSLPLWVRVCLSFCLSLVFMGVCGCMCVCVCE